MKLVIDGDAAAGTISSAATTTTPANVPPASRATSMRASASAPCCSMRRVKGKPVMIYVFSDGSLASDGTIDNSVGRPRQGRVDGRQPERRGDLLADLQPAGKATTAQSNIEASLQLGYFNPDGSQNTTSSPAGNNVPNLVQMVVLNYLALHSANDLARWPTLWPGPGVSGPNTVNTLGSGSALDPLVMYNPLAGLTNGRVVG